MKKERSERLANKPERDGLSVTYSGHNSMLASTPPWSFADEGRHRTQAPPQDDRFPKKEGPWMPATKHEHQWSGCAPNGMRLFGPAPSILLSKDKKKTRDQGLRKKLTKLSSEINDFESSNITGHRDHNGGKSLVDITAAHGRLVSEMRELQQVADLRCASRWEPGLGRRQDARAAHGRRVLGALPTGSLDLDD
jgi:hypothetical protein